MYVTPDQMKQLEALTDASGVSYAEMMERAGNALAEQIMLHCPEQKKVLLIAGNGNNGGDCYTAAFYLKNEGWMPEILSPCGEPRTDIAKAARDRAKKEGIPVFNEAYDFVINDVEVVVDGIFGTGFRGELPESLQSLLTYMTDKYRIACDVPSGGNCIDGSVSEGTLRADLTVTFGAEKLGMTQYPLREYCGKIVTVDIGLSATARYKINPPPIHHLSLSNAKKLIPAYKADSYKQENGHLLVIAGSVRMRGACVLASTAAMRSGVGMVTCASAEEAISAIAVNTPEIMSVPLATDEKGFLLCEKNREEIAQALQGKDAVLLGCGLGITPDTRQLVKYVLENAPEDCAIILDADGLNIVADCIEYIPEGRTILTPHAGEAARLLHCSVEEVQANRPEAVKKLAQMTKSVVILKGSGTIVSDGERMAVCALGNAGMAKAGSGDVLAGIVAGFAAKMPIYGAACAAVGIHAAAGDNAASKNSQRSMLPSDIISSLRDVL